MAQAEYTTAVLADTPYAFWKLDEASGLPQDSSGNARHFTTTTGTPQYQQTGPFSGAYGIRLTGTVLEGFTQSVITSAIDNITMEAWFSLLAIVSSNFTVFRNGVPGSNGFNIQASGVSPKFALIGVNTSIIPSSNRPVISATVGVWNHFAAVRRSTTWEIYWNGDLFNGNCGTNTPSAATTATGIDIGGTFGDDIYVSNVSFYETALSATRIRAHYEAAIGWTSKPLNTVFTSPQSLA